MIDGAVAARVDASAVEQCHACGTRLRLVRRSRVWDVDVGQCPSCGTVSVLDAATVVDQDLERVARTKETDWEIYTRRMHVAESERHDVLDELSRRIGPERAEPVLFDVGAGTGSFLDIARARGFRIEGNDISASAIEHAAARFGIELSSLDLADQRPQSVDAVTMWCVLAHVGDPHAFLAAAMRILRPGGVLFLRTPRHCSLDTMGETLARATAGRVSRLPDSRVTRGHLHLFSDRGMTELLNSLGFVDVDVVPVVHSGCTGEEILRRLGGPAALQRWSARMVDRLVASGTAPRNTMFVYARRPADSLQVPLN